MKGEGNYKTQIKLNFSQDTGNKYFDIQTLKEITKFKKEDTSQLDVVFINIKNERQFLGASKDITNYERNIGYNNNYA